MDQSGNEEMLLERFAYYRSGVELDEDAMLGGM